MVNWEDGEGAEGLKGPPALRRSKKEGGHRPPEPSRKLNFITFCQLLCVLTSLNGIKIRFRFMS